MATAHTGRRATVNPWLDFAPTGDALVHVDDQPFVDAYNRTIGREPSLGLQTGVWPHPWVGPVHTAPVLVLVANPGWTEQSARDERTPVMDQMQAENLVGDRPNFFLDPRAADTAGSVWFRERLLATLLKDCASAAAARTIAVLHFHAYHSAQWRPLPVTLPTQSFTFDLVRRRVRDAATVIITRAHDCWRTAVPELLDSPHVYVTNSAQQTRLSGANISPDGGWDELLTHLERISGRLNP